MHHNMKSDRPRPGGIRGARKALGGAIAGIAVSVGAFGSIAALATPTAAGAGTVPFGGLAVRLTPAEAKAAAHGELGLGSTRRRVVYTSSSCRGPRGYGREFIGRVWPGGFRGVPVFSNGLSGSFTACLHRTRTPRGRIVTDGYAWQCVELVDRLYLSKGWISSAWRGNGNQMFYTAPRYLRRQRQGHITYLHAGDVVSFDSPWGGYGHAAVIAAVRHGYVTIINQNTNRSETISHAYIRRGRLLMIGWRGWRVIGVVHRP